MDDTQINSALVQNTVEATAPDYFSVDAHNFAPLYSNVEASVPECSYPNFSVEAPAPDGTVPDFSVEAPAPDSTVPDSSVVAPAPHIFSVEANQFNNYW